MKKLKRLLPLLVLSFLLFNLNIQGAGVGPGWSGSFSNAFLKIADPDTSYASGRFHDTSIENGRVWADKTVFSAQPLVHSVVSMEGGQGFPLPIPSQGGATYYPLAYDEFMVAISALSQNFNITSIVAPTDVVFVIDISASMNMYGITGTTNTSASDTNSQRASLMVDALNEAISILMNANPNNRVGIVTFAASGTASNNFGAQTLLPLNSYCIQGAPELNDSFSNWKFISYGQNNFTANSPTNPSDHTIRINPQLGVITNQSDINTAPPGTTVPVNCGSAPANTTSVTNVVDKYTATQAGISYGAQMLMNVTDQVFDTGLTHEGGGRITIIRKPNIILLSDGLPNVGDTNITRNDVTATTTGNLVAADTINPASDAINITTILTGAYWKNRVRQHYFGAAANVATNNTGFYTIGVGAIGSTAYVLNPTLANSATQTLLRNALTNSSISIPRTGTSGTGNITVPTTPVNGLATYNYVTAFYPATSASQLEEAFQSIAQTVLAKSTYATNVSNDSDNNWQGNIIMSDVLGQYMEFRGAQALWINEEEYSGYEWASGIVDKTITTIGFARAHWPTLSQQTITDMITGHIAAGAAGNPFGIFAHSESDFNNSFMYWGNYVGGTVNFIQSYFDTSGNVTSQPANATVLSRVFQWYGTVPDSIIGWQCDMTSPETIAASPEGACIDLQDVGLYSIMALADNTLAPEIYASGQTAGAAPSAGNNVRTLAKYQYLVRWYIPGGLLPLRTVGMAPGINNQPQFTFIPTPPIRAFYRVGLRDNITSIVAKANQYSVYSPQSITLSDVSSTYRNANDAQRNNVANTPHSWWFYSNDWDRSGFQGDYKTPYTISNPNASNVVLQSNLNANSQRNLSTYIFVPNVNNPFYFFTDDGHTSTVNGGTFIVAYQNPAFAGHGIAPFDLENVIIGATPNANIAPATCSAGSTSPPENVYQLVTNVVSSNNQTPHDMLLPIDSGLLQCVQVNDASNSSGNANTNVTIGSYVWAVATGTVRAPYLFEYSLKDVNATGTANFPDGNSFIKIRDGFDGNDATTSLTQTVYIVNHYLGNNGRLTIPETQLTVNKIWNDGVAPTPIYVQLYANNVAYGSPVQLNSSTTPAWSNTWDNLPVIATDPSADTGTAVFVNYTIKEGTLVNGNFTPFSTSNPPIDGNGQAFDVETRQPQWNQSSGTWAVDGQITNTPPKPPTITKSVDKTTAQPGDVLTYTITVHNPNEVLPLSNLVVTDDISANLNASYISYVTNSITLRGASLTDASDTDAGSYDNGIITVNIASLDGGASAVITFQVRVEMGALPPIGGPNTQIPNLATLTPPNQPPINTPPVVTIVPPPTVPTLVKDVDKHVAYVGDILTYTLRLINPNPYEIYNFDVWDDLDTEYLQFVRGSITVDGESVTDANDGDSGYYSNGSIFVNIESVAAKDHIDITFQAKILAAAVGNEIENVGVLQAPPTPQIPPTVPTPPGNIPGAPPPDNSNKVVTKVPPKIPNTGLDITNLRISALLSTIGLISAGVSLYQRKKRNY